MNQETKLYLLEIWHGVHILLTEVYKDFDKATMAPPESPVKTAGWVTFAKYTDALSLVIDPQADTSPTDLSWTPWLDWFWLENDMGAKGLKVKKDNDEREIKTLEDLLWAIEPAAAATKDN